jgi:hypothetical protein
MHDYKRHVETNANLILDVIRNNANITLNELHGVLEKSGQTPHLTSSMLRKYIYALHKTGHVQKSGVHTLSYKSIKDEPFTYVPVAWNQNKKPRRSQK